MSRNGTIDQEPAVLSANSASVRGSFRDMQRRGQAGAEAQAAALVWSRAYVAAVVVAGCGVLSAAIVDTTSAPPSTEWWVLVALTLLSGTAVLKVPAIPANFSISDVFTLTAAVAFGPAAGTVAVALDSLVISARLARVRGGLRPEQLLFNCAAPPLAMWLSAQTIFMMSGLKPLAGHPVGLEAVAPWLLVFAGLYFVLNTFAIALAIALRQREHVLRIWRTHFQNLWLTFVGGALGAAFTVHALQLNVYGLALLSLPLLLALILHFAYRNATGRTNDQLEHLAEMNRLHLCTIEALARAIDAKDAVTHGHIRRVQQWAVDLARRMGLRSELEVRAVEAAALLHDVGKLAMPEHILNKPGRLTAAEFERMKMHAKIGAEILSEIEFPYPVVPIVRHHHENWDGTGYPDQIAGEAIPLGARILAVVDCYDALTSHRPYRRAVSPRDAFALIEERSGTMYDPAVVAAFRDICRVTESAIPSTFSSVPASALTEAAPAPHPPAGDSAIDEIALALQLGLTLSSVFVSSRPWALAATALLQVPSVAAAVVFRIDEPSQELVVESAAGECAATLMTLSMKIGERLSGWVAATGQPLIDGEATLDLFDLPDTGFLRALSIPVQNPDGSRMTITLYSSNGAAFSTLHLRLLHQVARLVTAPPPWRNRS
jgi:putative nucleotidyltransferase with HDIG domain